ncbi:YfiR family protein [Paracrocinitomix mangrovi]|uniref:YfiR family protein n=1 Tax=Paracrocinitomix mangrovi TaxID=2862509 RepID=UPI001C8EC263|nr:YfiR family protein [Paracrocinitomix mangrovi]UKN00537.1 YfiR family protein [Paracrocinitomix mangrovi]
MRDTRSPVKALYLYNFATLIDWPSEYRKGNFVIGVYGAKEGVYESLKMKYEGKAIGSQEIVVQNYTSSTQISDAHILYITPTKSSSFSTLETQFKNKSTLFVTEKDGYLSKGAAINFVVEGSSQKFEINKSNAKKHKLVIADRLLDLATKVVE